MEVENAARTKIVRQLKYVLHHILRSGFFFEISDCRSQEPRRHATGDRAMVERQREGTHAVHFYSLLRPYRLLEYPAYADNRDLRRQRSCWSRKTRTLIS